MFRLFPDWLEIKEQLFRKTPVKLISAMSICDNCLFEIVCWFCIRDLFNKVIYFGFILLKTYFAIKKSMRLEQNGK